MMKEILNKIRCIVEPHPPVLPDRIRIFMEYCIMQQRIRVRIGYTGSGSEHLKPELRIRNRIDRIWILSLIKLSDKPRCASLKENNFFLKINQCVVVNKYLIQIKMQILLYTCAAYSELPSNTSTINLLKNWIRILDSRKPRIRTVNITVPKTCE